MRKQLTFSKLETSELLVCGLLKKGIIESAINPALIMYNNDDEDFATLLLETNMCKENNEIP